MELEYLNANFLEAMNEVGRYGHARRAPHTFEERRRKGESLRGGLPRNESTSIAAHASAHFGAYLAGERHDHFGTRRHQLAAVAYNAMMEFYFAGLEAEEG